MLTTRLRAMLSSKGNGPWWLAVHLLEKGRQEGIKDVKVYNAVLKVKRNNNKRPNPRTSSFPCPAGRNSCDRPCCLLKARQARVLSAVSCYRTIGGWLKKMRGGRPRAVSLGFRSVFVVKPKDGRGAWNSP